MINRNNISIFSCLIITIMLLGAINCSAASIKDRMVARVPAINSLKSQGLIGENNKGFLAFRTSQKVQQDVVQGENQDRKAVYGAIAKKQGADPVLVGQRRAKQIAGKGRGGQWFQRPDGKWYKK
jgi:uncharacterized protein YdbL (DUF1318 family)